MVQRNSANLLLQTNLCNTRAHILFMLSVRGQWTTELRGSALMFPKSRVESVSSSISPITALKQQHTITPINQQNTNYQFKLTKYYEPQKVSENMRNVHVKH